MPSRQSIQLWEWVRNAQRFKRLVKVVDSTTVQIVAKCMDWAKHSRMNAVA